MMRLFLMCFVLCAVYGDTKPTEKKTRVHVQEPLSNLEHDDTKNHDYDHAAFLGKEQAKEFDKLSPEESKRRLSIIVDEMDANKDGFIVKDELEDWIKKINMKQITSNVDKQLDDLDTNKDGKVCWEEYESVMFDGYLDNREASSDGEYNFTDMVVKDKRRFRAADENDDMCLTKEELKAFLFPDEFKHMKGVLVQETIDEMDKNGDGVIDLEEYIADLFIPEKGESEPDWVVDERKEFTKSKDANKDGKLDKMEVEAWILPNEKSVAESEAEHLIESCDGNQDEKLSKEEILKHYKLFVGSQATEYGNILQHDEF